MMVIPQPLPEWAQAEERRLKDKLIELQRAYNAAAQPIVDELTRLEYLRPPPFIVLDVPEGDC